ncbi:MAG TPA: histidinol dehydrogenase, partial [Holophagaceae bacterium]|nr:histidinol dehydrogenase [Holophagaceae bacterium]
MARLARAAETEADTAAKVAAILSAVRAEGLPAALRFTEAFDGVRLEAADLRVPAAAMAEALARM